MTYFELMRKLDAFGTINVANTDVREFLEFLRRNGMNVTTTMCDGYNIITKI